MRRRFGLSLVLVLVFALPLGYFAWRTFLSPTNPDYRRLLHWDVPWISHPRPDVNQAYFRKKLHLNREPTHAWLAVVAPNQVAVFVNGKRVLGPTGDGREDDEALAGDPTRTKWTTLQVLRPNVYTQVLFDITRHLVAGTNVVAIENAVSTFPQHPRIAVQGAYLDSSGQWFHLASDASWKVALRDESLTSQGGSVTPTSWSDPTYDDGGWSFVVAGNPATEQMTSALLMPPPLVTEPLHSDWLWAEDATAPEAYFRLALDLPIRPRDAWLRVAAKRHYRLLVNEHPLVVHEKSLGTDGPEERVVRLYNIAPYVRQGRNVIAVQASNDRADRGFAVDGLTMGRDGTLTWLSSAPWKASPRAVPGWETLAFEDAHWRPALHLRPVTTAERSALSTVVGVVDSPMSFRMTELLHAVLTMTVCVLGCLVLWLGAAAALSRLTGESLGDVAPPVAFTFLLPAALLAGVYLLGFDPRLSQAFPYQTKFVVASVGLLLLLQMALIVAATLSRLRPDRGVRSPERSGWKRLLSHVAVDPGLLLAIALGAIGLRLRLHEMTHEALVGDEISGLHWSLGVLERGYPSALLDGRVRPVFTSELVYYVKALALWLLGPNAFALRLPDVIFGSLTIVLLYCVGKRLHGARVGLLAAAFYTFLPSAIGMTHYARYPSQLQFVALLTFILLFRAMEGGQFRPRRYWGMIAAFIVTYLSWEGAAFYGLALALGVLVLTRPNVEWLRRGQLWGGIGIVAGVIAIQLSMRYADRADWPFYGTGLADVVPALTALYPFYDPLYYLWTFFLLENHHLLTFLFALGIPLWCRRSENGRVLGFMGVTVLANLALLGNLLELGHWRYVYHLLPLLVLSAAMVFVVLLDHARAFCRAPRALGVCTNGIRHATASALVAGLLLFSTSLIVKLYDLPWSYSSQYTRLGTRNNPVTAGAIEYVRTRLLPGDVLVTFTPHVWQYYLGRADYYLVPQLDQPVFVGSDPGLPIQRNAGVPTLFGAEALTDLRMPAQRVWFISFGNNPANPEMNARMVYEDWRSAVFLFGPPNEPLDGQR